MNNFWLLDRNFPIKWHFHAVELGECPRFCLVIVYIIASIGICLCVCVVNDVAWHGEQEAQTDQFWFPHYTPKKKDTISITQKHMHTMSHIQT